MRRSNARKKADRGVKKDIENERRKIHNRKETERAKKDPHYKPKYKRLVKKRRK